MSFMNPPDGPCTNCNDHPADLWVADSAMDAVHGVAEALCNCCTVRKWRKQAIQLLKGASELDAEVQPPCVRREFDDFQEDEAAGEQPPA